MFVLKVNYSISYRAAEQLFLDRSYITTILMKWYYRCVMCVCVCVFVFYLDIEIRYVIDFFFFNFIFMVKYYYYGYGKNLIETKTNNKTETLPLKWFIVGKVLFVLWFIIIFVLLCSVGICYVFINVCLRGKLSPKLKGVGVGLCLFVSVFWTNSNIIDIIIHVYTWDECYFVY